LIIAQFPADIREMHNAEYSYTKSVYEFLSKKNTETTMQTKIPRKLATTVEYRIIVAPALRHGGPLFKVFAECAE